MVILFPNIQLEGHQVRTLQEDSFNLIDNNYPIPLKISSLSYFKLLKISTRNIKIVCPQPEFTFLEVDIHQKQNSSDQQTTIFPHKIKT